MSDMYRLKIGQTIDICEVLHPNVTRRVQVGAGCYLFIVDEPRIQKLKHVVGAGGFTISEFLNNTFETYLHAITALSDKDPFLE